MLIHNFVRSMAATCFLLVTSLLAPQARALPVYYLTTGQSAAQTQLDVDHTTTWSFTATSNWSLGGGNFTMKDGSHSSADIILSIYLGTSSAGTLLASLDLTNTVFCTDHAGNCQSFASTPFHFASPLSIIQGDSYFVTLTSTAADQQSTAYFIKGADSIGFFDANNNPLPGSTVTQTSVPEPTTYALMATGLLGLFLLRNRLPSRLKRSIAA